MCSVPAAVVALKREDYFLPPSPDLNIAKLKLSLSRLFSIVRNGKYATSRTDLKTPSSNR